MTIVKSGANPVLLHQDGASALKWGALIWQIPVTITNPEQYFINA
ncbi:hypothetical protein ACNJ8R_000602 [Cronobacter sakazakii]|nr:hypothetical protein [Cronobacter sakazakii]MDK1224194.1 hypothetical protein [Cronobacter turicensis]CCK02256.1 hypothetical protein BN129_766 [Cronobacter sakazakii 701]CCK11627.1 hypothetical protein BN126_1790 [Cronobacter sakazakii 680]MCZ6129116.1 hypothetical protein [Cronobacter sakazakii]MCZ6138713.1 hypothetical protein [Cronobacter sakazakii]